MRRNEIIALSVAVACLVIALAVLRDRIYTAQGIEIIILFILVLVTAIYVKRTSDIANIAKEQLLSEARPYLLLRLELGKYELLQWAKYKETSPPTEFPVTIRNEGKGPAINVEAKLWHPQIIHPRDTKGYLAAGEEWQTDISRLDVGIYMEGEEKEVRPWLPELRGIIKQYNPGAVLVRYRDIHRRTWVSYLLLERHDIDAFVIEGEQNIVEDKR